ncbi:MAG: alpha/beta hydrolase [Myxococcota bacterium]
MSEPSRLGREQSFGLAPPPAYLKTLELRAAFELAGLLPALPWLCSQPRGVGEPVMLIPGFGAGDRFMSGLRTYLSALGHRPEGWGLGINRGRPERDAERLIERLDEDPENPLRLVGWSLGGVIARLVARARPNKVAQIITMGTPVEGGPKYTSTGRYFARKQGIDLDAFEVHIHKINAEGLNVPLTVIYSESDGIVGSASARDRYNLQARHVRLRGASHLGMPFNPRVWIEVARALAPSGTQAS